LVLGKIRVVAGQLQVASQRVNFQNKSDEEDVKGLCDALVGLCKMAQPEISIIDQITSHPKFKHYAALLAFLATIRGALGL
jgi:archaellum biogenesis ATPase FlaH